MKRLSLQPQWENMRDKATLTWEKSFAPRYNALDEREQRIVRLAAIIIPLAVLIFGIILPVADKNTALQQEVAALSQQAQEANALADVLALQPKQQGNTDNNILSQVDNIARQTAVRTFMTRLRPQQLMGDSQQLLTQIKDVPYKDVVAFIAALEKAGFSLSQLKIQAAAPGYVHMQATIDR